MGYRDIVKMDEPVWTQCAMNLDAYLRDGKYAETDTIKLFLYRNNKKYIISTYAWAVHDIRPKK